MASNKRSSAGISEKEKPSADGAQQSAEIAQIKRVSRDLARKLDGCTTSAETHALVKEVRETTKAIRAKLAAPFGSGRGGVFGYAQESDGPSPAFGGSPFTFGSGAGAGLGPPQAVAAPYFSQPPPEAVAAPYFGQPPPEAVAAPYFGQPPVKKAKSKDEARLNVQQARRELEEAHRDADVVRQKIVRAKAKYERAAGDWIDWDLGVQPL